MANRHLLRTIVMQALYESEFRPEESREDIVARYLRALDHSTEDAAYVTRTISGVQQEQPKIDGLIRKHAPEWPLEQIAGIDRAVLRLGIYETLHSDEVPPKVAINEAVEIAKGYGGENSGSFVNGVLGTIYRASDRYEPGNEKKPAKKAKKGNDEPKAAKAG